MLGIIVLLVLQFIGLIVYFRIHTGKYKIKKSLKGQIALVTGGTAGIGRETASQFAAAGAKVFIACRNTQKGEEVADAIRSATFNNDVHIIKCDLADFDSVRTCADELVNKIPKLDILVNNAGVMHVRGSKRTTKDGLEELMQSNHFGHLLTNLLMKLLKSANSARIVNVSSLAGIFSDTFDFDPYDTNYQKKPYVAATAYGYSKLCNILFTRELSNRLSDTKITVNCLHPGVITTDLSRTSPGILGIGVAIGAKLGLAKTVPEGAATQIFVATSDDVADISGQMFKDCALYAPSLTAMKKNWLNNFGMKVKRLLDSPKARQIEHRRK